MAGPWEKYAQKPESGPWAKYAKQAVSESQRDVVATTDDGGVIYRGDDGALGFTSPGYATTDPEAIDRIMQGATPADVSKSGFDQQTIEQAPVASRAVKFLEGVPFAGSYTDEAAGAILGPQAGQGVRAASGAMERENPGESLALGLAGGVAGSLPLAAAAPSGLISGGASTVGGQAIRTGMIGAGIGATEGAIYGSGRAEGDGRLANAQQGGIFGAGAGAVLGTAAPYASRAVANVLQSLKKSEVGVIARELGISPKSATVVKNALDAGDMRKAEDALNRAGPNAMLADAGIPTQQLLDASASKGGRAAQIAADAVDERVSGVSKDLTKTLDDTFGKPVGVKAMARDVRQSTGGARQAAYDAAYSKPINYSGSRGRMIEGLLTRVPQSAINQANALMRAEGAESAQIIARIADNGKVTFDAMPDVRQIDYITRALGDVADQADGAGKLGGQTQLGSSYNNLKRNLRNALKGEIPEYAKALDVASDAISRVKAGELGNDLLKAKTTRETVADALRGASAAEKDAAKQGVRTYIDDTLANVSRTITDGNTDARESIKLLRDMSSRANRQKIEMVLGKKATDKLMKELDTATVAFELRAALASNSKTNIRGNIQSGVSQQSGSGLLESLASGEPVNAAKRFVQALTGSTEEAIALREAGIYEEIATALTNIRGTKAKNALKLIELAKNGKKLTEQQAAFIGNTVASSSFLVGNREASRRLTTQ